jgi:hypothetical protein
MGETMNGIWIALAGAVGVPALGFFWGLLLKPATVHGWGEVLGKAASALGQRYVGRAGWETLEKRFGGTLSDFVSGIQDGLTEDPPVSGQKPPENVATPLPADTP